MRTKGEKAAYNKSYYDSHRDQLLEYARRYREKHPGAIKDYLRKWNAKNKEKAARMKRAYYTKNKDRLKAIASQRAKNWYAKNKEAIAANRKANAVAISAQRKEYYQRNKRIILEKDAIYKAKNADKYRAAKKSWSAANKEIIRERGRKWRKNNPDKARAQKHRKRARRHNASGSWGAADVAVLKSIVGHLCLKCGSASVVIDHVIPLARGGTNHPTNLQPLCVSCNSAKGARSSADYRTKAQIKKINAAFQLRLFT